MDEFLRAAAADAGRTEVLTLWELVFALTLSLLCSIIVCAAYRRTHRTVSYSQSYVQSLVLVSLITTVIMLVIGSNIARAFSLVGALSIIRFRNPIKETRDVVYIFFAIGIAMACGTRFYALALISTLFICTVMVLLDLVNFGAQATAQERLLRVRVPADHDPEKLLEPSFRELFKSYALLTVESVRQGMFVDALFSVVPKVDVDPAQVLEKLSRVNENLKVTYHFGLSTDDL